MKSPNSIQLRLIELQQLAQDAGKSFMLGIGPIISHGLFHRSVLSV